MHANSKYALKIPKHLQKNIKTIKNKSIFLQKVKLFLQNVHGKTNFLFGFKNCFLKRKKSEHKFSKIEI